MNRAGNLKVPDVDFGLTYCVGSFYPDNSGGPTITMYWMAKALFQNGVVVRVLTTNKGIEGKVPADLWLDTDFGKAQYVTTVINTIPITLFCKSVWALRNTKNLYLASFFYPLSFLLAPIALMMRVNVIWGPRGETSPSALQYGKGRKKVVLWLIRRIKKYIVFHATSPAEADDIRSLLGDCRIELIPVGMEIPEKQVVGMPPCDLLFLGRIHPIKGLENLIEALAITPSFLNSDHRLKIAGYAQMGYDDVLKNLAEKLGIRHKVEFIGRIDGTSKERLLAGSYALILPSFSENFGAVVAESLAQGTPVIASSGTPWSILNETSSGIWSENSPDSLAISIDKLIGLPDPEYQMMRENARKVALEHLDINSTINKWIPIIQG